MLPKSEKPNLTRSLNLILLYHSNNGSKKFIGKRPWEAKLGEGESLACLSSDTGEFFKMKPIASRSLNTLQQGLITRKAVFWFCFYRVFARIRKKKLLSSDALSGSGRKFLNLFVKESGLKSIFILN
jgi:hypothetical protein